MTQQVLIRQKLTPSKRLNEDAHYYVDTFLNSQLRLAVMIRSERVSVSNLKNCLSQVVESVSSIAMNWSRTATGRKGTLPTLDVGKYGSITHRNFRNAGIDTEARSKITHSVTDMVGRIYGEDGWSFNEWEQSYLNASRGNKDGRYLAALQRTLASKAGCLILMGGGSFQEVAFNNYVVLHPDKSEQCVRTVCISEPFMQVLMDS